MDRRKYPRTPHLPYSPGATSDDVRIVDLSLFAGNRIVITEKLDGENTTVYWDGYVHARSLNSKHHPSRSWIKGFAQQFSSDLPRGWRVCGENLFAFHSIFYKDLPSCFLVFGIYNENNLCLSWNDTVEFCHLLGLNTVPVLYQGSYFDLSNFWTGKGTFPTFAAQSVDSVYPDGFIPTEAEGFVVRIEDSFPYFDFDKNTAKWVRENHVQTDAHWMERKVIPNLCNRV